MTVRTIPLPNIRLTFLLVFATSVAMMIAALIMQYVFDMEPCPLCVSQRVFVILAGVIALIATIQTPGVTGTRVYSSLGFIACAVGGGISARHVWLQNLPEHLVPTCGPGLSYMFDALPFLDALKLLFQGDGNCADVVWNFLGLSIPAWTLICFIGLAIIFIWQGIRASSLLPNASR